MESLGNKGAFPSRGRVGSGGLTPNMGYRECLTLLLDQEPNTPDNVAPVEKLI